jgi:hypothetical protein
MTPKIDILFTHLRDAEDTFSFYTYPKRESKAKIYGTVLKICE